MKKQSLAKMLPSVYQSEVNKSLFEGTVDQHLSSTDLVNVSGTIGKSSTKQIAEPTAFKQNNQLQPVLEYQNGNVSDIFTFEQFLSQLKAIGVDITKMDEWGASQLYNYAPPINFDKFANYQDYYWVPPNALYKDPQYITIENKCRNAQGIADSFKYTVDEVGSAVDISYVDVQHNSFVLEGSVEKVFSNGFMFYTVNPEQPAIHQRYWSVQSSNYNMDNDTTIVYVNEQIGETGAVDPSIGNFIGQLFFNTASKLTKRWSGSAWVPTKNITGVVDFVVVLNTLQNIANCLCGISAWDMSLWDNNSGNGTNWSDEFINIISYASSEEWIAANGTPELGSQWYDLTTDTLKHWKNNTWTTLAGNFSLVLEKITNEGFDTLANCPVASATQWSSQNFWKHKTQVSSYVNTVAAQMPILEFSQDIELTSYVKKVRGWKYAADINATFATISAQPTKLELVPIINPKIIVDNNIVKIFCISDSALYDDLSTEVAVGSVLRYSTATKKQTFIVNAIEYRQLTNAEKQQLNVVNMVDHLITVITTSDIIPQVNAWVEPTITSNSDSWMGYNIHWCQTTSNTIPVASVVPSYLNSVFATTNTKYGITIASSNSIEFILSNQTSTIDLPTYSQGGDAVSVSTSGSFMYTTGDWTQLVNKVVAVKTASMTKLYSIKTAVYIPETNQTKIGVVGRLTGTEQLIFGGKYNLASADVVRVYINGQLTTAYTTNTKLVPVNVVVGKTLTTKNIEVVTSVTFTSPIAATNTIRIEFGTISQDSIGAVGIIRTIEDNATFAQQQPIVTSIVDVVRFDQPKIKTNQYPLFNIYSPITKQVITSGNVFAYGTSETNAINVTLGQRLDTRQSTDDYVFVSDLYSNNQLYAYRNVSKQKSFVFNNKVYMLKDGGFTTTPILEGNDGLQKYHIVLSKIEPDTTVVWADTQTKELKHFKNGEWTYLAPFDDIDNSLQTIWAKQASLSIPQQINGGWILPKQWTGNIQSITPSAISWYESRNHFANVVSTQPIVAGLPLAGRYSLDTSTFNYGLGGTIHLDGEGYNLLVTAMLSNTSNPISIIEFANRQYQETLNKIVKYTIDAIPKSLTGGNSVDKMVQSNIETNTFMSMVFGDSTVPSIKNLIATLPSLGLSEAITPEGLVNEQFGQYLIRHHDNHISDVTLDRSTLEQISRDTIANAVLGKFVSTLPNTITAFEAAFNAKPTTGSIAVISAAAIKLYRMKSVVVASTFPAKKQGYVFKTTDNLLYVWNNNWMPVTGIVNDISALWEEININQLLVDQILKFEHAWKNSAIDRKQYTLIQDDIDIESRFNEWCKHHSISQPLHNNQYIRADAFTWNYGNTVVSDAPTQTSNFSEIHSCWQSLYQAWFGTSYPHLEPWRIQGYLNKPTWWDNEYADGLAYKWKRVGNVCTMWDNIRNGIVPAGRELPSGAISLGNIGETPQYSYVPINTTHAKVNGFAADTLLPPYFASTNPLARSFFVDYNEIVQPASDFIWNNNGFNEWKWRTSCDYKYDQLQSFFAARPIQSINVFFKEPNETIDGLSINVSTGYAQTNSQMIWHGAVVNNQQNFSTSINQWYVNFYRYHLVDVDAQVKNQWKNWQPKLAYLTSSIIDDTSIELSHTLYRLSEADYEVKIANSGIINDLWIGGVTVSTTYVPPKSVRQNSNYGWKFEVDFTASATSTITKYKTKRYTTTYDKNSGNIIVFSSYIRDVIPSANTFIVEGNITSYGTTFVTKNTGYDATYHIVSSVFDYKNNITRISVVENINPLIQSGIVIFQSMDDWKSGSPVVVSTGGVLPYPLTKDTAYYLIATQTRGQYKLAVDPLDVDVNSFVEIDDISQDLFFVGELESTYNTPLGLQYHFAQTNETETISLPIGISGLQDLLDLIDGMVAYQQSIGIDYKTAEFKSIDPETGRMIDWQFEIDTFISLLSNLQTTVFGSADKFEFIVTDIVGNIISFSGMIPTWSANTPIVIRSSGTLPTPLLSNTKYFLVRVDENQYQLSYTPNATSSTIINLTNVGSGQLYISQYVERNTSPKFEINPNRNTVCVNLPYGRLANVISGPYDDIKAAQTIFDSEGNRLSFRDVLPLRFENRALLVSNGNIGGAHLFVEGYEHAILFNNSTVDGNIIFNPLTGNRVSYLTASFKKSSQYNLKPSLGGFINVDDKFVRNITGSAEDLRTAYHDDQATTVSKYAKDSVLFSNNTDYFAALNLSEQIAFKFHKGFLQYKGTKYAVDALTNHATLSGIDIDEFWAIKLGNFGQQVDKSFAKIKLLSTDVMYPELRLALTTTEQHNNSQYITELNSKGFQELNLNDSKRWVNINEASRLIDTAFDLTLLQPVENYSIWFGATEPTQYQNWFNTDTNEYLVYVNGGWIASSNVKNGYIKFTTRVLLAQATIQTFNLGTPIDSPTTYNVNLVHPTVGTFAPVVPNSALIIVGFAQQTTPIVLKDERGIDIKPIPFWNPLNNIWLPNVASKIDFFTSTDPAQYNVTLHSATDNTIWQEPQVGQKWIDLTTLGFVEYDHLEKSPEQQLVDWGKLATWSNPTIYEWTSSTIRPTVDVIGVRTEVCKKVRTIYEATATNNTIVVNAVVSYQPGSIVVISNNPPSGLNNGSSYVVASASTTLTQTILTLVDLIYEQPVLFNDQVEPFAITQAFADIDSVKYNQVVQSYTVFDWDINSGSIPVMFDDGDLVDVWLNNEMLISTESVTAGEIAVNASITSNDVITLVHRHYITQQELDLAENDDGTQTIEWSYNVPYVSKNIIENNQVVTKYFYWSTNPVSATVTVADVLDVANEDNRPYYLTNNLVNSSCSYIALRNIQHDMNRSSMFTLGAGIVHGQQYSSWKMIRENQLDFVGVDLWNKLVDAIAQVDIDGNAVPSTQLQSYDLLNNTNDRIGFDIGQTMIDRDLAIATIVSFIENNAADIAPVDSGTLLSSLDWTNARNTMQYLYDNLSVHIKNRLWFACFKSAMSLTSNYNNVIKTSWLAVHSKQLLNVNGELN